MSGTINIGNTDENADWIKGLPGHEDEASIHEALAERYAREREETDTREPLLSTTETMQATVEWWRENMPPRYAGLLDATLKKKGGRRCLAGSNSRTGWGQAPTKATPEIFGTAALWRPALT